MRAMEDDMVKSGVRWAENTRTKSLLGQSWRSLGMDAADRVRRLA